MRILKILLFILFYNIKLINSQEVVIYNLFNGSFHSFNQYSLFKHQQINKINKIGIFLLGSMLPQYFNRGYISKNTWALYSKHFFLVTGNGIHEKESFSNTSFCTNITHHYLQMTLIKEQQVYICDGVHVLHITTCNSNSWGPNGPCCRCQGAMKFFLAMYEYSNNPHSTISEYPEWFIFSDDDYYIRLHLLQSILYSTSSRISLSNNENIHNSKTKLKYDSSHPYIILPHNPNQFKVSSTQYTPEYYRWGKGLEIFDKNCTRPCIHNIPWLGFSGFSIGALKSLKLSLWKNELVNVCSLWQITHDVGVGVYVWLKGFTGIPILHDSSIKQVLWHKPHRTYDQLFDEIWNDINIDSNNNNSNNNNNTFDMIKYLHYETKIGQLYSELYPPYQLFHIHNTLLYRRIQLRNELLKEIYNLQQREVIENNQNYNIIQYSHENCYEDSKLFDYWKENIYLPSLLKSVPSSLSTNHYYMKTITNYEPKICLDYSLFISNYQIKLNELGEDISLISTTMNLERKKLRNRK